MDMRDIRLAKNANYITLKEKLLLSCFINNMIEWIH